MLNFFVCCSIPLILIEEDWGSIEGQKMKAKLSIDYQIIFQSLVSLNLCTKVHEMYSNDRNRPEAYGIYWLNIT